MIRIISRESAFPADAGRASRSRRQLLGAAGVAAAGAMLGGGLLSGAGRAGSARAAAASDPAPRNRLRYQGWSGTVLVFELAEALGFLAPLQLHWVGDTSSGPQDLQAAATGSTDVAGAFNGSVMKLIGAGAPVRAVIAYQGADPETCSGVFVRADSPIRGAADLAGRTVGVNTLRAQQECFVDQLMLAGGVDARAVGNVTLVPVSPVVAEAALRHGRIEAVCLSGFLRTGAISRGGLRELASDTGLYGSANMDSLILRDSYLQQRPEEAARFVAATACAIAWLQRTPRADAVALLTDIIRRRGRGESRLPMRSWRSSSVATPGGIITPGDFTRFQGWYGWRGDVRTATLPAERIYTNRFNPYAAA